MNDSEQRWRAFRKQIEPEVAEKRRPDLLVDTRPIARKRTALYVESRHGDKKGRKCVTTK